MTTFIGRSRELCELKEEYSAKRASLVVLNGRRRIGKTSLIEEFSKPFSLYKFTGLAPFPGITAQDQRNEFVRKLEEEFKLFGIKNDDWATLFTVLAKQVADKEAIILLDEISWMAIGDPGFLSKLKTIWDDCFSKNPKLMLVLCGSVSSWIEKNILSNTGYLGRPTWSIHLEELPLDQCNEFWGGVKNNITAFEKLKILSITGGVPRYLELMDPRLTAEQNIQRLCFNKNAPLYKEFEYIFSDIYGLKSNRYQSIVQCLADGLKSREDISKLTGLPDSGDLTEYLNDLELGGFIQRNYTWSLKSTKTSKLSKYRLKDNYTRFYLKYILPNRANIEKNLFSDTSLSSLRAWNSIVALQFENLICNNLDRLLDQLGIAKQDIAFANPYFQRKTARQQALQIDYMIQVKQDTVYICEIKFSRNPISRDVIEEMQNKAQKLALPKHISKRFVLIHVNGVCDALLDEQFFQYIINFGALLGNTS